MGCFRLEHVHYAYDRLPVLSDIDLVLGSGEILGLFGHNGAGKTTTIKLILGLMQAQQGKVTVLGGEAGHPEVSQHIGYLPENVMFYPQLTGREILTHFARLKGAPMTQVPELLAQVGLAEAMSRRVKTYSKGMRQRLGLAQALLGEPKLLMLDEPTVGLDPIATTELYRLLLRLRDAGTGVVICSHVLPGVEPYIDRAAILSRGVVMASGDLPALRRQASIPVRLSVSADQSIDAVRQQLNGLEKYASDITVLENQLIVDVPQEHKLAAIRQLAQLDGISDLQVDQPSLEDLYCHFITADGAARAGDEKHG